MTNGRAIPKVMSVSSDADLVAAFQRSDTMFRVELHQLVLRMLSQRTNAVQCRRGCAWCCSLPVTVTAWETQNIVTWLQRKGPMRGLEERLQRHEDLTAHLDNNAYLEQRVWCPFLSDSKACQIYEVRPLACACWHSVSVRHCRDDWGNPQGTTPRDGRLVAYNALTLEHVVEGLQGAGYELQEQRLSSAILDIIGVIAETV